MPSQIAQALSWARTRPDEVVQCLRERLHHYRGKDFYPPERAGRCVVTKEGVAVVEEAIKFVESGASMEGVGSSSEQGLALAAEDHVADVGQVGTASHSSSDGTSACERVSRYGSFASFGECLWYGSGLADARSMVLDLIVDDGVPSRGHRKGVLNPQYNVVGCAYGSHATFGRMAAMEFAKGWEPNQMFIRSRLQNGPVKISEKVLAGAKEKAETTWSLGSCAMCSEKIRGGKVVEIKELGGKLHGACFKCSKCSTSLVGGTYKVQSRSPFCTGCFLEEFGETCKACSKVIDGASVSCGLGKFHVDCLVCCTCNKSIGKAPFSTAGGVINCNECAGSVSRPGSGRPAATRGTLKSVGSAIAGPSTKAKAKPKPKPAPKMSMAKAKGTTMAIAMDYAALG